MDMDEFLQRAELHRRVQRAHAGSKTYAELQEEFAASTMPLKITVMNERVFVSVDGLARALMSY